MRRASDHASWMFLARNRQDRCIEAARRSGRTNIAGSRCLVNPKDRASIGAEDFLPVVAGALHVAPDQLLGLVDVAPLDRVDQLAVITRRRPPVLAAREHRL